MEITTYKEQDKNQIVDLIVNIQRNEFQIPITAEQQPDLNDIPGFYQTGAGNFWVARLSDKVVGTISLLDIGNGQAALRKMFVDKDFRGSKHGTAIRLLSELIAWAKSQKLKEIYLGTTSSFHAAHRFYEKNGFIEIAKEDLPSTFPVMEVDTKFYRYAL
jgi:N-acetylglutamate synthase-like GNAT family acetyltransferase